MHTPAAVDTKLLERIRSLRSLQPEDAEFAERLLDAMAVIERDFTGDEREGLLAMVHETLDRHVELTDSTRRARELLQKLRDDQKRLGDLFDFLTAQPARRSLH